MQPDTDCFSNETSDEHDFLLFFFHCFVCFAMQILLVRDLNGLKLTAAAECFKGQHVSFVTADSFSEL